MTILSNDYDRLRNPDSQQNDVVENYKETFASGDIDSAKNEINTNYPFLAMSAKHLNDLCDTIVAMENIWAIDKTTFTNKILALGNLADAYDTSHTYYIGDLVYYNSKPFLCIVDGATGGFDITKWLLLTPNELGVTIKGLYDSSNTYVTDDITYIVNSDSVTWRIYNGNTWVDIVTIYPPLRFLEDESDAYSGEIYITPLEGGGN